MIPEFVAPNTAVSVTPSASHTDADVDADVDADADTRWDELELSGIWLTVATDCCKDRGSNELVRSPCV